MQVEAPPAASTQRPWKQEATVGARASRQATSVKTHCDGKSTPGCSEHECDKSVPHPRHYLLDFPDNEDEYEFWTRSQLLERYSQCTEHHSALLDE